VRGGVPKVQHMKLQSPCSSLVKRLVHIAIVEDAQGAVATDVVL
jgi:hypothetical protein